MDAIEILVIVVVGLVLLPYVLGPFLVKAQHWQSATPEFPPIELDDPEVPAEAAEYLRDAARSLKTEGFSLLGHYKQTGDVPNIVVYLALFEGRDGRDAAMAAVIGTVPAGAFVPQARYVEFFTRFADGARILTNNSPVLSLFPEIPGKTLTHFPDETDPAALYRVHLGIVRHVGRAAQPVPVVNRKPEELLKESWAKECVEHEAIGYHALDPSTGLYRLTWKGAFVMTYRSLWPLKGLRKAKAARRAAELLAQIGKA